MYFFPVLWYLGLVPLLTISLVLVNTHSRDFLSRLHQVSFLYAVIYTYIGFAFKDSWVSIFDVIVEFSFTGILFMAALFALYQLKKYLASEEGGKS